KHDRVGGRTCRVTQQGDMLLNPYQLAVLANIAVDDFEGRNLLRKEPPLPGDIRLAILGMHKGEPREFAKFLLGIAKHRRIGGIAGLKAAFQVRNGNAGAGILEYSAKALLAGTQRRFRAFSIVDIDVHANPLTYNSIGSDERHRFRRCPSPARFTVAQTVLHSISFTRLDSFLPRSHDPHPVFGVDYLKPAFAPPLIVALPGKGSPAGRVLLHLPFRIAGPHGLC